MSYAGESIQKKIARALAYQRASIGFELNDEDDEEVEGGIVCLSGPEAHDVGPIKEFFPEHDVLFVDSDPECIEVARSRMPQAKFHIGPLHTAEIPWPVKLAVLDFCGHLDGMNFAGAVHVMKKMPLHGTAIVTTLRGREARGDRAKAIKRASKRGRVDGRSLTRAVSDCIELAMGLRLRPACDDYQLMEDVPASFPMGRHYLSLTDVITYNGRVSPMMVASYRKETEREVKAFAADCSRGMLPTGMWKEEELLVADRTLTPADLLELAETSNSGEISAQALDVSSATFAAWKAHRTMGTYA